MVFQCLLLLLGLSSIPIESATSSPDLKIFLEGDGLDIPDEIPEDRSIAVISGTQETITCTVRAQDTSPEYNVSFNSGGFSIAAESDIEHFSKNGKKYVKKNITLNIADDTDGQPLLCEVTFNEGRETQSIALYFSVYEHETPQTCEGDVELRLKRVQKDEANLDQRIKKIQATDLDQRIIEKARKKFQATDLVIESRDNITGNARAEVLMCLEDMSWNQNIKRSLSM